MCLALCKPLIFIMKNTAESLSVGKVLTVPAMQ